MHISEIDIAAVHNCELEHCRQASTEKVDANVENAICSITAMKLVFKITSRRLKWMKWVVDFECAETTQLHTPNEMFMARIGVQVHNAFYLM